MITYGSGTREDIGHAFTDENERNWTPETGHGAPAPKQGATAPKTGTPARPRRSGARPRWVGRENTALTCFYGLLTHAEAQSTIVVQYFVVNVIYRCIVTVLGYRVFFYQAL